jgi:hypothetical protein
MHNYNACIVNLGLSLTCTPLSQRQPASLGVSNISSSSIIAFHCFSLPVPAELLLLWHTLFERHVSLLPSCRKRCAMRYGGVHFVCANAFGGTQRAEAPLSRVL